MTQFTRLALVAALALCAPALADSFKEGGLPYKDVTIKDIKNGKLVAEIGSNERSYDLATVTNIETTQYPKLTAAENARPDPAKAWDLYRTAIGSISNAGKKRVAQARAIPIFDAQGRFADAINAFLDVYQNDPSDGTLALRPRKLPDASSTFLKEAASAISNKLSNVAVFKSGEPQKHLRELLLEIYVKLGDTTRAAEVSKLLGVDVPSTNDTPTPDNGSATAAVTPHTGNPEPVAVTGSLLDVENALTAKNYDRVISLADALLPNAKEDSAVRLFKAKAQAYLAQKKPEEAVGAYLRISAHYPTNREVPEALYAAAEIQASLKHADEAQALIDLIKAKYKDSGAAVKAARIKVERAPATAPAPR